MTAILCLIPMVFVDDGPAALKELEGRWKVVAAEEDGTIIKKEDVAKEEEIFIIHGNSLAIEDKGKLRGEWAISLPPGQELSLDLKHKTGPHKDQTCHAIYKLEGDTLKICVASNLRSDNVEDRPTVFSTQKQNVAEQRPGKLMFILKREKKPK